MYIGVDVGGTNIVAGVVNKKGDILAKEECPTDGKRSAEYIIGDCISIARKACEKAGVPVDAILSMGLGLPGSVDYERGTVIFCPNIPFADMPLAKIIRERWDIPVWLINDANAAAFGETVAGSAKGCANMVFVTIGTGIGGGIISHGRLYTGCNGLAGELGHVVIQYDGLLCGCGRRGCFERYASASGLIAITKSYMDGDRSSSMWELAPTPDKIDGRTAFAAAKKGDAAGKAAVDRYIGYLACGLCNIVNCFQPEVLCIGGGICNQGDYLMNLLKERMRGETFRHTDINTMLRVASLGNDAGIIGAALIGPLSYEKKTAAS